MASLHFKSFVGIFSMIDLHVRLKPKWKMKNLARLVNIQVDSLEPCFLDLV